MICDATMDLGHEENIFSVFSGNVDDYVSLGRLRGHDPSIGSYSLYLEDLPRKVIWTTFSTPSYDFRKAFDKIKRILIVFDVTWVLASCLVYSKLWSQEFDKLPRVFIKLIW